ncbi:MAG: UDP-N-acetylglucosamine 1-carboxyvinyltransferase [Puniceicoccales bacterium]|jgi:UDP-N-acetylglucosamine 1-carboxyvinyltransferase|nr:UDP-N-acetylglucosamine 1-carboxyvinyltransferase [Puniceicoccales bacterium]
MAGVVDLRKREGSLQTPPVAKILGGKRLVGDVVVGGSKNACLPMLAASLLTGDECVINNVPNLSDTTTMVEIIRCMGADVSYIGKSGLRIRAATISSEAPRSLVKKMRGSVCLMGALVGRKGKAVVPVPGGCVIGDRPIDLHVKGFESLGCSVFENDDLLMVDGTKLHSARIFLGGERGSTVTGTMNVIMVALRAAGMTIIESAAIEPEVTDFCGYLTKMGAKINGVGTRTLEIDGGHQLHGCEHTVIGDRIEAGTFVCAGLITGGDVRIFGLQFGVLDPLLTKLRDIGANVSQSTDGAIRVKASNGIGTTNVVTGPHPQFPTDLQAQLCSLLTQSDGESTITDNVYPNRFLYVPELMKMGADISVSTPCARIHGRSRLSGAHTQATDLRASAALYLAGLCASGETFVHDVFHLDRGYENFEKKLRMLGAAIERVAS